VVNGKLPVKNLQDFVAYAKSHAIVYGSAGVGTTPHLAADAFNRRAGLDMVHVPYRGSTAAMTDVIGGNIPMTFVSLGQYIHLVRQGTIRVLGIAGPRRVTYLPDVGTFAEQGFPNLVGYTFVAVLAPAGTADDTVRKIAGALRSVIADPEVRKQIETLGAEPEAMLLGDFRAYLEKEAEVWLPVVRKASTPQ